MSESADLALPLPLVIGPCDPRVSLHERAPTLEGGDQRRLEGVLHHIVEKDVDFGAFEHEDHLFRREIRGMGFEAALLGVERRPLGKELGCLSLETVPQTPDDRNLADD
jgi:hypothetical protein